MKVLRILLVSLLTLFAVLFATAILTLLAWWLQWPLVTGIAIVLAVIFLFVAFFGVRAFLRWNNRRRFVQKVVLEQKAVDANVTVQAGRITKAWQNGIDLLESSIALIQNARSLTCPWIVVLDCGSSQIFSPFGDTVPNDEDSPLIWHFLAKDVLLHIRRSKLNASEWEECLEKLAEKRKSISVRAIVLLLQTGSTLASEEGPVKLGAALRTEVQQLKLVLGKDLPVQVLMDDLSAIPGLMDILEKTSEKQRSLFLGQMGKNVRAMQAVGLAGATLGGFMRSAAARGSLPFGDMLKGLETFEKQAFPLSQCLEEVCRHAPHRRGHSISSIAFCQAGEGDGFFITDLTERLWPKLPDPPRLTEGLPFMAGTQAWIMGAWLLFFLSLCALMTANVLHQHAALTAKSTVISSQLVHDIERDRLYRQMRFIRELEKAKESWFLPTFAQDFLTPVINSQKDDFTKKVYADLLAPLLDKYRKVIATQASLSQENEQDMSLEIAWLTAVASRTATGEHKGARSDAYLGSMQPNTLEWGPVAVQLVVHAINWMSPEDKEDLLTRQLRQIFIGKITRKSSHTYDTVLKEISAQYPAAHVCLSQFWPHISSSDPNNVCIGAAFTQKGYRSFRHIMEDLESLDDKSGAIIQVVNAYRQKYFRSYTEHWVNFIKAFTTIRMSMQEGDVFSSYTDAHNVSDLPHYQILEKLGNELLPLLDAKKDSPHWLSDCFLLDVVFDIATFYHHAPDNRFQAMLSLLAESPELLARLRAETRDARHARQIYEAAENLTVFFGDILEMMKVVSSPEKSLALAQAWFGNHTITPKKDDTEGTQDTYADAMQRLKIIMQPFAGHGYNPALELLPALLDFTVQGVTIQTARVLQKAWENEVLSSTTALYRQDDVAALFGENGVVQAFVNKWLKPFLSRRGKIFVAAGWGNVEFPFTSDCLHLLSQAEMLSVQKPEDTYFVRLRSQPTLVNVDAAERVDTTTLTLQCQEKNYTLLNRNYPRDEMFQYTVKQCGSTSLEIRFPSFTLKRSYATFPEFLKEFQFGEQNFTPQDFESQAGKMKAAGVKEITVRILPDNGTTVLQKEANDLPSLPDRITYVW